MMVAARQGRHGDEVRRGNEEGGGRRRPPKKYEKTEKIYIN